MSKPALDPTRWFTDLIDKQKSLLASPFGGVEIPGAKQWTDTLASLTTWQVDSWNQLSNQWAAMFGMGSSAEPIKDRRFSGEAWTKDPRFEAMGRAYLTQVDQLNKALEASPLDERSKGQWRFALRQVTDALSPANNLMTNPEAQKLALETGGKSLIEGMKLFTEDLAKGRIAMTDESAFQVGENIATSPGSVIFQNEVMQVIQYSPSTDEVYERPLVIIPPAINKFYILDLQPANSFVGHAVAEGHTVFLVSWRNVGPEQGQLTWDDYINDGVLRAIEVALEISGADKVNTLGFCVGGTLLASALAILQARDEQKAASMTLLTTLLDFSDTGEIGLLVDERGVAQREAAIGKGGVLQGSELAQVFSSLRANDLIWPYVVKGYLQGQAPPPFDLLYWNSDDSNLPGPMFCWYIRNTYLENKLREPGGTTQSGVAVDLGTIDIPSYLYASRADHIVPWESAYASTQLLGGEKTFVLGASGHIAGVINPPAKKKRNYWVSKDKGTFDPDPNKWLDAAESVPGSWWPTWHEFLIPTSGEKVAAPETLGNDKYTEIEAAPGSYVKEKAPKP